MSFAEALSSGKEPETNGETYGVIAEMCWQQVDAGKLPIGDVNREIRRLMGYTEESVIMDIGGAAALSTTVEHLKDDGAVALTTSRIRVAVMERTQPE